MHHRPDAKNARHGCRAFSFFLLAIKEAHLFHDRALHSLDLTGYQVCHADAFLPAVVRGFGRRSIDVSEYVYLGDTSTYRLAEIAV